MKMLIILVTMLFVHQMGHGADINGPYWAVKTDALRLSAVSTQVRDPRTIIDEPWTISEIEYRLAADRVTVVVTEGQRGVLDPKRYETPIIAANTIRTVRFACSFVVCKEDEQYTVGVGVQPHREAREPDRGSAAVYLSARAAKIEDAISVLLVLLERSRFSVGAYGEKEAADEEFITFLKREFAHAQTEARSTSVNLRN